MKKSYFILLLFLGIRSIFAQVGINTTTPNAQLEIKSSDQAAPSNTDGILIPKVDVFPATNPTAAQQGMLVYLTTTSGTNLPGFYFWDNSGTPSWKPITGSNIGSLDQAYDFGGAGNGKTITADAGAVTIDGTDGLVSTGVYTSGAIAPSGPGTRMVWNPRKAAFRAGDVDGIQWDDENIGIRSVAFGLRTTASGNSSSAFGQFSIASGAVATAFGRSTASGQLSTAFGANTIASGQFSTAFGIGSSANSSYSTAFGFSTSASQFVATAFGNQTIAMGHTSTAFGMANVALGDTSTAFGRHNIAKSYGETVIGIGATDYTPSSSGASQFGTANATDRLFVIGNAIDTNSNFSVDDSERSDALIILKNGLTRLPSTTNAMINAADGKTVVTKEYLQNTTGTLDQAYDFGGAGNGKTITADAGAVTIDGTDGLVSTGVYTSGAIAPSGPGTRMVWNPRKAAFRAGDVDGTQWDDENIGIRSVAFGLRTTASGNSSSAFGQFSTASGDVATAFGRSTASGLFSTSFGVLSTASGDYSTVFGVSTDSTGNISTAFGYNTTASGDISLAYGQGTNASGELSTAFGHGTTASGKLSASFGRLNAAKSYVETVFGIGATDYTPSTNGESQFRTTNATDRLFVIGNAIDANNNDFVDSSERSDALVILKNGNAGFGSSTPQDRLHVVGNIRMVDGNQSIGKVLTSDANGTATWQNASANAWGIIGNSGSNSATNFIGTTDNQSLAFRTNNIEKARITENGDIGIGTTTPARKVEISGAGDLYTRITNTSSSPVGIELKRSGSDWQIRNEGGDLIFAMSNDNFATINSVVRIGGSTFTPVTDNLIQLGQNSRRWLSVHAVNGVIQTSDATDKKEMLPLSYGLEKIKSLRPISFQWKDAKIDNSSTHLGFVAQEVQQVLPEVVVDHDWKEVPESQEKTWEKTEKLGMKYAEIIPVLVKAVQEQQAIIEVLKAKIEALEKK